MESLSAADPQDTGHRRWLAVTYTLIGNVLSQQNRFDEAQDRYRRAIAIGKSSCNGIPSAWKLRET